MDKHINEILALIEHSPNGASFYQIVRGFGFPDASYDLQLVLRVLVEECLVELQNPDAGVNTRYVITQKGIEALKPA